MQRLIPIIILAGVIAIAALAPHRIAKNPDPNHTHADFAVWIDGKQLDFSGSAFMSTKDGKELNEYLHMHDGNGHVIHRHKPGLTLRNFLHSISIGVDQECDPVIKTGCWASLAAPELFADVKRVQIIINGRYVPTSFDYHFQDMDQILITTESNPQKIVEQWAAMTNDACLYSKTCPERGPAPTESCIADPTVPCKQ